MATTQTSIYSGTPTRRVFYETKTSTNSPRVNGRLELRENAFNWYKEWETGHKSPAPNFGIGDPPFPNGGFTTGSYDYTAAYNQAYASFKGKLRYGSGEWGMTLGSIAQTRRMVISRVQKTFEYLTRMDGVFKLIPKKRRPKADESYRDRMRRLRWEVRRANRELRRTRQDTSWKSKKDRVLREISQKGSAVLEYKFGWGPLFSDIYAWAKSVVTHAFPNEYVSGTGRGRTYFETDVPKDTYPQVVTTLDTYLRVTVSARVTISNPNAWLLNRLGLINPGVVLWDLVPWSWVIGMVVNIGDLISSFSDFYGLNISNPSVTVTHHGDGRLVSKGRKYIYTTNPQTGATSVRVEYTTGMRAWAFKRKTRTLTGTIPRPSLEFKVPKASLGLATTALALVAQRLKMMA